MATRSTGTRSLNSIVALGFGVVFTLAGLAGFLVSDTFAATDDATLLGFEVNDLHNIVHLLIGVVLEPQPLGQPRGGEAAAPDPVLPTGGADQHGHPGGLPRDSSRHRHVTGA